MIEATYMVCGCMDDANRLGPANENGSDASPNTLKPKGSLPNNPPPASPNKAYTEHADTNTYSGRSYT